MINKKLQIILLFMFILGMAHSLLADEKIKLRLHQPPPNKLGAGELWKLDITNTTNTDIVVYLTGTATEEKDGLIVDGKSKVFTVKPGKKTYGYNDFKDGEVSWKNKTTQEAILRTGNVKSGSYTICVTAYYENGSVADNEQCITQVIENLSQGTIALISPSDGEELDPDTSGNLAFMWAGISLEGPYNLRIVELRGSQSQDEAIKENRPILDKKEIKVPKYNYSLSDPKLEKGKKYAWQVSAGEVKSDVYSFFVSPGGDSINLVLTPIPCQGCCFSMSISGHFTSGWNSFKLTSGSNSISSVTPSAATTIVSQSSSDVTIKQMSGFFTTGENVGVICFNQVTNPFPVSVMWSTNGGLAFVMPADQMDLVCPPPCPTGNNDTCIDFEGSTNVSNWIPYFINSIVINNFPSDPVNTTNVLVLTDDQGGSIGVNNTDFTGNWLNFGQEGCLCFDYKVNWVGPATPVHYPKLGIYTGAPIPNTGNPAADVNEYVTNRIRASFVGWPAQPVIQDNVWNHWCLAIGLCSGGNLPSNSFGYWQISNGTTVLTGAAACTAWDNLIQNVTGFVLYNDYNSDPSEIVSFDNFCWTCSGTGSTGSICDSLNATVSSYQGQGNCCWSVNLQQPSNLSGITAINLVPVSPTSFVTASVNTISSAVFINSVSPALVQLLPSFPNNTIPAGNISNLINYCLNFPSSEQKVVVQWMGGQNFDSLVCSDTIITHCEVPCVTTDSVRVECSGDTYNVSFPFHNISHFDISNLIYSAVTPPTAVITPNNYHLPSDVAPNGSGIGLFNISGVQPNTQVCVLVKYASPDSCCWCFDTLCFTVPACICDTATLDSRLINGDPYNCCYDLLIKNLNVTNFTNISIESISTGVYFASRTMPSGWVGQSSGINPTTVNIFKTPVWTTPIITGNNINIMHFCLGGYTSQPQTLVLKWMRGQEIVCTDTLKTDCVPPPPVDTCAVIFNDTLICNPDNTFTYNFQVANFASWTALGLNLTATTPGGLVISPNTFNVNILTGGVSPMLTTTISGVPQNTLICFQVGLYNHPEAYSECCYSDDYCITTPVCGQQDSCDCGRMLIDTFSVTENNHTVASGLKCGSTITGSPNLTYTIGTPLYDCSGNCSPTLTHKIFRNGIFMSGGPGVANITPNPAGVWESKYYFHCGTKLCDSCSFFIRSDSVSPGCLETSMDSIWCIKDSTGVQKYGYTINLTNLTSTANNYVLSNSCGTFLGVNFGTIPANGSVTASGVFSSSQTGNCCITTEMFMNVGPNNIDTCYDTLCFTLPDCGTGCDPCTIQLTGAPNAGDTLCKGSPVTIHWTGGCPGGMVNISFIDYNGWVVNQMVAVNVPNTGSYNWTIPANIACDSVRRWEFYVEDVNKKCWSYGPVFYVKCCDTTGCQCGGWEYLKYTLNNGSAVNISCGETITMSAASSLTFNYHYLCVGQNCQPGMTSQIFNSSGAPVTTANNSLTGFNITGATLNNTPGVYTLKFNPTCGGINCPECRITIILKNDSTDCKCNEKASFIYNPGNGLKTEVKCGETINAAYGQTFTFNPSNLCIPKECLSAYTYMIYDLQTGAYVTGQSMLGNVPFTVTLNSNAGYKITVTYNCNGKECKCEFYIRTKGDQGNNCPKFLASPLSIRCHNIFMGGNYDFQIAVSNFETSAGNINLQSMSGGSINSYSPTTAGPNVSTIVSGNATVSGSSLCIKVRFSVAHGKVCDTTICFNLPHCGIHFNDTTKIGGIKYLKLKTLSKYYLIGLEYLEVHDVKYQMCFCANDPLTAVPCEMIEEYCFSQADPFDPAEPWWETEAGKKERYEIDNQLEKMGLKIVVIDKNSRTK